VAATRLVRRWGDRRHEEALDDHRVRGRPWIVMALLADIGVV
jgi:hypothetical protein